MAKEPVASPHAIRRLWVQFDAPDQRLYDEALGILYRKGYKEWRKMSHLRLKAGKFVQRPSIRRLYWVEMTQGETEEFRRNGKNGEKPLSRHEIRLYFGA